MKNFFIKALSPYSLLSFHQVVLKALDPVFEIEDPYAYNIQGNENTAELMTLRASC